MFNPCTDQEYRGIKHGCVGRGFYDCSGCEFVAVKKERDKLQLRIREELEPRLSAERRSYDRQIQNAENEEEQDD